LPACLFLSLQIRRVPAPLFLLDREGAQIQHFAVKPATVVNLEPMNQHITTLAILFLALLNLPQTRAQTADSAKTKLNVTRDIPKSVRWVHDHIAEHGGDPKRILVMGHSAGAQLAALICTDDRYLKAEGLSLAIVKGCVPVDGDTYDVPAIIETAETRLRAHGLPMPKFGHRLKFGNDPEKHRDFSAVTHVAKGKGIPPFLI